MKGVLISGRQIISSPSINVTISSRNPNVKREYLRTVVHHSLWAVMTQPQRKKIPKHVFTIHIINIAVSLSFSLSDDIVVINFITVVIGVAVAMINAMVYVFVFICLT
mmetsp:Transcript_20159/g.21597  ORF Transcript_20159/g.21597 Transcript_20159/m.21597 type:complete len:108 (+) Transcript_20159:559-882(+)